MEEVAKKEFDKSINSVTTDCPQSFVLLNNSLIIFYILSPKTVGIFHFVQGTIYKTMFLFYNLQKGFQNSLETKLSGWGKKIMQQKPYKRHFATTIISYGHNIHTHGDLF